VSAIRSMKVWAQVRWFLPACVVGALAVAWMVQTDFVPAGPMAESPGFGPGSDWDLQWSTLEAGRSAALHGGVAHWDPFPDYGSPVLAHPESFVAHPAWLLGARGDGATGLHLLYASALLALFIGFPWLAVELSLPWFLGTLAAAAVVASFEWEQRLYSGHLMFLGTVWWPPAVAGVVRALREQQSTLWAGAGGAAIGLGSLGGGHYPTLFGVLLLALVVWAHVVKPRWQLSFLALAMVGVTGAGSHGVRWWVSGAAAGVLLGGVLRAKNGGRAAIVMISFLAGLMGVAGFRLVPGFLLAREVGRVGTGSIGQIYPSVSLSSVFGFAGGFEGPLHLASPFLGVALLVSLVVMGVRHSESRVLVLPVASLTLIAWGSGGGGTLWPLLHTVPGLSGVNYPLRLQWVLLYFGPFVLAWLIWLESRGLGPARTKMAGTIALVASCLLLADALPEDRSPHEGRDRTVALSRVVGVLHEKGPQRHLGLAARDGLIREGQATALGFQGLAGDVDLDGVQVSRAQVTLHGVVGAIRTIPQRHLPGWTCVGASVGDPDPARLLTLTLEEPAATCRFRSPGLALGMLLQVMALLGLAISHFGCRSSRNEWAGGGSGTRSLPGAE